MRTLSADAIARIREHWGTAHWVGRDRHTVGAVTAQSVLRLLEHPGIHYPYVTLVSGSVQPPLREFTSELPGYRQRRLDAARVRQLTSEGYTMKFHRLEDLDEQISEQVAEMQEEFGLVTTAYAFVTPTASEGLSFHRDASHVVVRQLEGEKVWNVVRPAGPVCPDAGLEAEPEGEQMEFTLTAGDILYLPHGWPHCARTLAGRSTHLTYTLARPHPAALAAELLDHKVGQSPAEARTLTRAAVDRLGL